MHIPLTCPSSDYVTRTGLIHAGHAQAAGLAADNLMCAVYFATLFSLAQGIPADPATDAPDEAPAAASALPGKPSVQVGIFRLALPLFPGPFVLHG